MNYSFVIAVLVSLTSLLYVKGLLQYNVICNVNRYRYSHNLFLEIDVDGNDEEKPQRTAAGGYAHTDDSRAKISAANRGKVPWNKGRKRSAEEKARISVGVRARNREILLKKLAGMNITEEEYYFEKKEKKRLAEAERRKRRTENGGYIPTEETKQKISRILKAKYKSGEIVRSPRLANKGMTNRTHSEETKARISESLRKRWKDEGYRKNMKDKVKRSNSSEEVRKRISETLKKKWQDPEFRQYMVDRMATRDALATPHTQNHRQKISATMKRKWQDKKYRDKAMSGMSKVRRATSSPASRAAVNRKISETMKLKWQDQNYRASMTDINKSINTSNGTRNPSRKTKRRITSSTPAKRNVEKRDQQKSSQSKKEVAISQDIIIPHTTAKSLGIDIQEDQRRVTKLRQERRDLYDLLYGDDDDDDYDFKINGVDDVGNDDDKQVKLEDFWSVVAK